MSRTTMGVEWWILTIGISRDNGQVFFSDPLLLLRTKKTNFFWRLFKIPSSGYFSFYKEKCISFSSIVTKFVIEEYLTPAPGFLSANVDR
jgi:hypothetical protein